MQIQRGKYIILNDLNMRILVHRDRHFIENDMHVYFPVYVDFKYHMNFNRIDETKCLYINFGVTAVRREYDEMGVRLSSTGTYRNICFVRTKSKYTKWY